MVFRLPAVVAGMIAGRVVRLGRLATSWTTATAVALAVLASGTVHAQTAESTRPIEVGQTHMIAFAPGDLRQVNVYLPPDYAAGDQRYPVLYLIDGGLDQDFLHVAGTSALNALWGRSLPAIVVGIQTRDRRAELIGSRGTAGERQQFPTAGRAADFRAFLRDKVKPLVESTYRVTGDDGVIGESLAGLFIVETWLVEPGLFDRYAAIDPSLWWEDLALARSAAAIVHDGRSRGPIYLTYSNEGPATIKGVEAVAAAAGAKACLVARPDLTHATAYHVLTPQALQFLFPAGHRFEPEWGFDVPCSPSS